MTAFFIRSSKNSYSRLHINTFQYCTNRQTQSVYTTVRDGCTYPSTNHSLWVPRAPHPLILSPNVVGTYSYEIGRSHCALFFAANSSTRSLNTVVRVTRA